MIITYPNEILRKKSESVKTEDVSSPEIKKLAENLKLWIKKAGGVGLAAVQIGVLKRVIAVELEGEVKIYINPKIIRKSWKKISIEEACLSVPGKSGYVKRSEKITAKTLDESGKDVKLKLTGLESIIFQHEIDHLDGILFIDKVAK